MGYCVIALLVIVAVMAIAFKRKNDVNFTSGSGMFKNSEYNLDDEEKEDFCDYRHIDEDNQFK